MIFGRRAFFGYVVDPAGGTVWFANVPRAEVSGAERAATTAQQWQRQLVDLFADDHGPATTLIAEDELELIADNTHDLPRVPTWHKGPMVIIGDAAHAPSPSSGQGASMATEDAVVLAKCLRDLPESPGRWPPTSFCDARGWNASSSRGHAPAAPRPPGPSAAWCAT